MPESKSVERKTKYTTFLERCRDHHSARHRSEQGPLMACLWFLALLDSLNGSSMGTWGRE